MWQSGCRCICVSRGRVGLRPPIRMPGWNSHCSLALSSGSLSLSSACGLLLGRKLITCFYDVNYFAELFSRRFSAARPAYAERVADANAIVRRASPRGRGKPRKTRGLRKSNARDARATSRRASARGDLEASSRRRRAAAAADRARRVDLAKVRGFFPDAGSARVVIAVVAAKKKPASSPARVGRRGSGARQAASADSSALANASMSAAVFVSVVHSSSASSMPA
jgi:hypothetical protein